MQLAKTGELKLLQKVRERFKTGSGDGRVILGIGDDAAVIAPSDKKLVVTTDMMNEGVHFDLVYCPPFDLGFKLISVNASDVMAMGCRPMFVFLDLAFTPEADEALFDGIYDGIEAANRVYGTRLLGGDLCSSRKDTVLAATLIGEGEQVLLRSGARPGERIYVTSVLGDSAAGLEIIRQLDTASRELVRTNAVTAASAAGLLLRSGERIGCDIAMPLIKRHSAPVARDSAPFVRSASAMIDISDGLFIDLNRLCDESRVGAEIYLDKVPVSACLQKAAELLGLDSIKLATSGGEDYELLFTSASFDAEAYNRQHDIKVTCIGEIVSGSDRTVIDRSGNRSVMTAKGYEHFGSSQKQ